MQIPSELRSGQPFKSSVVNTINNLIRYLKTQRIITDGKTITANQTAGGVSLSAHFKQTGSKSEALAEQFNHPWKMSIVTDNQGNKKLYVQPARIEITGGEGDKIIFDDFLLPLPEEADTYAVVAYYVYDPDAADGYYSYNYYNGIVYVPSDVTTEYITDTFGFHTFQIGNLIVEEAEASSGSEGSSGSEEFTYTIGYQFYTSSMNSYDDLCREPFGCHIIQDTYPEDGAVVESLMGDTVIINAGQLFIEDVGVQVPQFEQEITRSENLYCLQVNPGAKTGVIVSFGANEWEFHENGLYNLPLAYVGESNCGYEIQMFLYGAVYFGNGGKVLLNEYDGVPDYLENKLVYDILDEEDLDNYEQQIFTSDKRYIVGITHHEGGSSSSGAENLNDELFWNYSAIENWDISKDLVLSAEFGELAWQDWYCKVSESDQRDYLNTKFENSNEVTWSFNNNKIKATVDTSSLRQEIGKVKVREGDHADYLINKLVAPKNDILLYVQSMEGDSSSSSSGTPMGWEMQVSLNVSGTGLLFYDNGNLSVVEHPENNAVLAWINGEFRWIELADCETACESPSSSSSSSGE